MLRQRTSSPAAPARLGVAVLLGLAALSGCGEPPPTLLDRGAALLDDRVALLDPDASRRVRTYLAWVGEEYGVDYHVVLDELGGETPERRALALFAERAADGASDGRALLLLVDPAAQQVRVEVGYALEPYLTDLAASRFLADYLAPHFRAGAAGPGIEASIEALVDELRPGLESGSAPAVAVAAVGQGPSAASDPQGNGRDGTGDGGGGDQARGGGSADAVPPVRGSGGAGASLDLLRALPEGELDADTRSALAAILVPQPAPEAARALEIALLRKGFYIRDAALYDAAWRRSDRPGSWSPARLREIGRQWDRPFEVATEGSIAVAYYRDAPALGPTFLRREGDGWIIDATATAATVVYDYSNDGWYARDAGSSYLALLRGALPMRRVSLRSGGAAWMLE